MTTIIYCDFDGTITQKDTVDLLLERLADKSWLEIEAKWERGEIGSRECLSKQIPMIKGGWKAIEPIINEVKLDPSFKSFVSWCSIKCIPLVIVSEGLDRIIKTLLLRDNIIVDAIWANHLIELPSGDIDISFPHKSIYNDCRAGLCKCSVLDCTYPKSFKIVMGDGLSDLCWSGQADLFFAKSKILNYCKLNNVPCEPFENFNTISSRLEEILEQSSLPVSNKTRKIV